MHSYPLMDYTYHTILFPLHMQKSIYAFLEGLNFFENDMKKSFKEIYKSHNDFLREFEKDVIRKA